MRKKRQERRNNKQDRRSKKQERRKKGENERIDETGGQDLTPRSDEDEEEED